MRRPLPAGDAIRANMTPMIDVVFLLIVFFMLVAQISRDRSITLELPGIDDSRTARLVVDQQVVINVVPDADAEPGGAYRIAHLAYGSSASELDRLTDALRRIRERRPDVEILLRADRVERYGRVQPLLDAARASGIRDVGLVTTPPETD